MSTRQEDLLRRIAERRALAVPESGEGLIERATPDVSRVPGRPQAALAGALRGATFGFSDVLGAAIRAIPSLVPGGASPRETFEAAREAQRAQREEFPITSTVSGVGGAVAQGIVAAPLLPARLAVGGIRAGAALGAVEGGLTAAGTTEGGIAERAAAVPLGVAAGAAGGAGGVAVMRGAGAAGRQFLDFLNLRPAGGAGMAARAGERLSRASRKDLGVTREAIESATRPTSLVDVDPGIAGLARSARSASPGARDELGDFLSQRVVSQGDRILDQAFSLAEPSGTAGRSLSETIEDIVERRSRNAAAQYGAIRDIPIEDPGLADLFKRPAFRDAYALASTVAANKGAPIPPLSQLISEEGVLTGPIPLGVLDQVKQGLDGVLQVGRQQGSLSSANKRAITGARQEFVDLLDKAVPEYAAARSAFAGESALIDAEVLGRRLFKDAPEESERILRDLGESEREMFVRGALKEFRTTVEAIPARFDATGRRLLGGKTGAPVDAQRLRLLFPDDAAFEAFQDGLAEEARIAASQRFITGGSQTFDKAVEFAEFAGVDVGDIAAMATGNIPSLVRRAAQKTVLRQQTRFLGRLGEELAPSLTATGDQALDVLDRISRLRQQTGRQLTAGEAVAAILPAVAAGTAVGRRDERR